MFFPQEVPLHTYKSPPEDPHKIEFLNFFANINTLLDLPKEPFFSFN
jgi:hypothetical protein